MHITLENYTITHQLKWRAKHLPNNLALCYLADGENETERLTYQQLDRAAVKIAARLQSFDLQKKNALLLYSSGLEFVKAFFGCLYAGVVAVPTYVPKSLQILQKIEKIKEDCNPQIILTTQDLIDEEVLANSKLSELPLLATDLISAQSQTEFYQEFNTLPEDIVFIQYTSGSTSDPKGAMVSNTNIMVNQVMLQYVFQLNESSVGITWLPLFHDMGLIASLLSAIYVGYPIFIMPPAAFIRKPLRWLQCITKYKGTYTCAPNFAYDLCIKNIPLEERNNLNLISLKKAINASEPVQPETLEKFTKEFSPYGFKNEAFTPAYGLAEATVFVSGKSDSVIKYVYLESDALKNNKVVYSERAENSTMMVSCGLANVLDQDIKIINPNTLEVVDNEIGEICISGAHIVRGYFNKPDINKTTFGLKIGDRNYLRTGDLGFIDRGGHLYITGRIKDLIIIHGNNYYPQDIELQAEREVPLVRKNSIAAFAYEENHTEQLIIVVELNNKMLVDFNPDKIAYNIHTSVFRHNELVAHEIIFISPGTLPKTTSGKIQRQVCKRMYLNNELEIKASWKGVYTNESASVNTTTAWDSKSSARTNILNCIIQFIAKKLKIDPANIQPHSKIADFNLDSIHLAELMVELEKKIHKTLPEKIFYDIDTLEDMTNAIVIFLAAPETNVHELKSHKKKSKAIAIPKFKKKFSKKMS